MDKVQGVWCPSCHNFRKLQELNKSTFNKEFDLYECNNQLHSMVILLIVKKEVQDESKI